MLDLVFKIRWAEFKAIVLTARRTSGSSIKTVKVDPGAISSRARLKQSKLTGQLISVKSKVTCVPIRSPATTVIEPSLFLATIVPEMDWRFNLDNDLFLL